MIRRSLLFATLAAGLSIGDGCTNKKKARPTSPQGSNTTRSQAITPTEETISRSADRHLQAATKALQEASKRRAKKLDDIGK